MSESEIDINKETNRRFVEEALNPANFDLVDELFTEDFVNHGAPPGVSPDREGLKQYMARVRTTFPDFHAEIDEMVAEGDLVIFYSSGFATHEGWLRGEAPTGKRVESISFTLHRMRDGKIAERWYMVNQLELMREIGLLPAAS